MSRRPIHQYKEEQLTQAMAAIRDGMKIRAASRTFGVPRGTIQDRLHLRVPEAPRKMGPNSVLTKQEETTITNWCIDLAKCGFPLKEQDLINTVHKIIAEDGRSNPFVNNRPGKKWYQSFLKRNPELSHRTPEDISKSRAVLTEESIRKWFDGLQKHLEDKTATDILSHPDRIFNGDETSFYLCPKTGKVIAPKGYKNVYKITQGKEKETLTVLLFMSPSGAWVPPCVVFPYKRIPKDVAESVPDDWYMGKSDSGWMRSDIFFDYVSNGLNQWVENHNIQKPILVFVDGHKSHLTMQLSQFCDEKNIILYALPPNATHLIQPADVSVFRPLKSEWKHTVHEWTMKPENINNIITKSTFCPLLKNVLEKENLPETIKNGFRKCGLYPFDPNALDYTKCVQNTIENLQTNHKKLSISPKKINQSHINTAIRVIRCFNAELQTVGIEAKTVIDTIQSAKQKFISQSVNSEVTSQEVQNGPLSCNLDDTEQRTKVLQDISNIDLPIIGDQTLENNLSFDKSNYSPVSMVDLENLPFEIVGVRTDSFEHNQNENDVIFDPNLIIYSNPQELNEKKNDEQIIKFTEIISVEQQDKPTEPNIIKNEPKKPIILSNIIKAGNVSPVIKKYLKLPSPIKKTSVKRSTNRNAAISSKEWRQFEVQKEEEKEKKKADILLRKLQRKEAKEKKEQEANKRKAERALIKNIKKIKTEKKKVTSTV